VLTGNGRYPGVDVLVVGAGPAGLAVARSTAAAGLNTLVVERQREVGEHVRTSGATALQTVTSLAAPPELYHRLARLRILSPSESVTFDCPDALCILDVRSFYRWLAKEAQAAGARIRTSAQATAPLLENGAVAGWHLGDEPVPARIVVDAGGHRAQVSKRAGLHEGFTRFGVGAEYELVAPGVDETEAVLIVGERYAPTGYAWSFPWGESRARLGVGLHHTDVRDDPKALLALLREESETLDLGLAGATVSEHHFGLIPAEGLAPTFVANGLVAVGDAAGQASLVVGEGIRISLLAGEMAAETIVEALGRGRTDRAALLPYEERFRSELSRELRIGERINRRLAANRDDARWDARVRLLRGMPAGLVVDLLQSRFDAAAVARWYLRRPWQLARSTVLARAALGRL